MQTEQSAPAGPFDAFARFYDGDYRDYEEDLGLILELAEEQQGRVLELGVGTGRVLLPLVDAGHEVTGVDLSAALLAVARNKLEALGYQARASLVEADLLQVTLPPATFALAICTSNTLMHLADGDAQLALLHRVYSWLAPGGLLMIDLFSPDLPRLLEVNGLMELADRWQDLQSGATVLKWSVRQIDIAAQLQETTFLYEEQLPDGSLRRTTCPFMLRWIWPSEGALMLRAAGFTVEEMWGDFDGSPYDGQSEHLIFLARKVVRGEQ
jgi:SAM-dependent methyltransferase